MPEPTRARGILRHRPRRERGPLSYVHHRQVPGRLQPHQDGVLLQRRLGTANAGRQLPLRRYEIMQAAAGAASRQDCHADPRRPQRKTGTNTRKILGCGLAL